MPPKKTEGAPKAKTSTHASYQDMITEAIVALKDRNGSSRQSLKKFVKANNNIAVSDNMFDSLFNKAIRNGVDKGVFEQPKGASGGTKLAKKATKPAPKKEGEAKPKKAATKKEPKEKKAAAPKKAATEKKPAAKKAAAPKKAATEKKPAAKKAAAPKKAAAAPAVVDKPKTLTKTKSGRVAKTTATPAAKKAAPKKAAPKKEKTPKKAEAAA